MLQYINYTVKSGDNLYSIARKFNTTVDAIKRKNNLTSNNLSVGQVLKIPVRETTIYTVKRGDTLYSIAREYNTSIDEIDSLIPILTCSDIEKVKAQIQELLI